MDEATNVIERPPGVDETGGERPVERSAGRGWRLAYNPALDGIRGVAVGVVLLFHAGFPWARGGYLGVSTFFTLSGFLITSLLLAEHGADRRIALGAFWAAAAAPPAPGLAGHARGGGLRIARVRRPPHRGRCRATSSPRACRSPTGASCSTTRATPTSSPRPSPVLHFWSLAIEEQFYWLFPLLTAGVFLIGRGSVKVCAAVLAALLAVSAVATAMLGFSESDAPSTTPPTPAWARSWSGRCWPWPCRSGSPACASVPRLAAVGGVIALRGDGVVLVEPRAGDAVHLRGGLLVYALLSGTLVLAACVPGPVRRALAIEPLRRLGLISYGVYLVHWPIFLVLDGQRTGLDRVPLFVVRVAVTLAVATASYFLLEKPIRRGWSLPRVPMAAVAGAAVVVVTVVGVVVRQGARAAASTRRSRRSTRTPSSSTRPGSRPTPRSAWPSATRRCCRPGWASARGGTRPRLWCCRTPTSRARSGARCRGAASGGRAARSAPCRPGCDAWVDTIPSEARRIREAYGHLDFAVIQTGPWEVTDRRLPGDDEWRAPGDPVYDDFLAREFAAVTDAFMDQGLVVVWVLAPHIDIGANEEPPPEDPYPESDPARMDRLNEIVQRVAAERQGAVTVDLPGYLAGQPGGEMDDDLRADGVHFTLQTAYEVAHAWLGQALLDAIAAEPNPLAPPHQPPASEGPVIPRCRPTPRCDGRRCRGQGGARRPGPRARGCAGSAEGDGGGRRGRAEHVAGVARRRERRRHGARARRGCRRASGDRPGPRRPPPARP